MRLQRYAGALLAGLVLTLPITGAGAASTPPREALTAEEAIACIRTAVAAQAGFVREVEGDDEGGKRVCEVKLVDEAGKRHKLHIDVQTNQVIKGK